LFQLLAFGWQKLDKSSNKQAIRGVNKNGIEILVEGMGPLTMRKQKSVLGNMTDMLSSRGYCKGSIYNSHLNVHLT
jgi:hypothetical protein